MAFCINCGQVLAEGAKFCAGCGTAVNDSNSTGQRKTTYDGEIHKCPNCGEVLNSFVTNCPSCGYEIRGASTSNAVKEFATQLTSAKTQQEKAAIIRNFPIPNTKEDVMEFMILASTNITNNLESNISAAWQSKTEQAYQKAKILFQDEEELLNIQNIYSQVCTKLTKQKKIETVKKAGDIIAELMPVLPNVIIVLGWLLSIFVLLPLCRINLDNVGTNGYQLLLMFDLIAGSILIPFAFRCDSPLPKLITSLGLILSIIVLIPLCGENLDNVGTNTFHLILILDIICSVIILIRMFKQKGTPKFSKTALSKVSFVIALACMVILLVTYGIGSIITSISIANDNEEIEREKHYAQSVTYEWPQSGLSTYLPLPPTEFGDIQTDDETRFQIEVYQVSVDNFESYVAKCKDKGFTIETTKTDSVFYAYHNEKYELDIFYDDSDKIMKIHLDAPEKMSNFKWPSSKIAKKLPITKSLVGRVWSDTSDDFGVDIADVSQEDFAVYIEECMKKGFTVDYTREDDFFNAYNKTGDELTLRLQVFDVMQIYIESPDND